MLITLAEYKEFKKLTSPKSDTRDTALIAHVSTLIQVYCRRTFVDYYGTNKTEYFHHGCPVFLTETPIVDIVSVQDKDDEDVEYVLADDGVLHGEFPVGINALKVIYKGGYEENIANDIAYNIPKDLKMAIILLVEYYKEEHYIKRRGSGSDFVEYIGNDESFPGYIKLILNQYRI